MNDTTAFNITGQKVHVYICCTESVVDIPLKPCVVGSNRHCKGVNTKPNISTLLHPADHASSATVQAFLFACAPAGQHLTTLQTGQVRVAHGTALPHPARNGDRSHHDPGPDAQPKQELGPL